MVLPSNSLTMMTGEVRRDGIKLLGFRVWGPAVLFLGLRVYELGRRGSRAWGIGFGDIVFGMCRVERLGLRALCSELRTAVACSCQPSRRHSV